jgi:hypothetical protein
MSADVVRFVNELLETEPGERDSVQLFIDTEGDECAKFEVMLLIMTEILKRWYPPPITISAIDELNRARLVGYFASFGISFHLDVRPVPAVLRINNRDYLQKSRLSDMKFQIVADGQLYTVTFVPL